MRRPATPPLITPAYTVRDLTFDPEAHVSRLPDGREVPHVTAVLAAVGVSTDFGELQGFSRFLGEKIEHARARGTAVHADCHAFDDDDLVWETVHDDVLPYVDAWREVREAKGLTPLPHGRERIVFEPREFFAGILDGVFLCGGRRVLGDIKSGDPESAACHLQTAAYEMAWNAAHPDERIDERWAIQLVPGARVPYRIKNYSARPDAHLDAGKWRACLCVYREQPARRRKVA